MKTGLTKKQKVTEVFYNAKDPAAEIYTHDTKLKKRLLSYAAKYPELCKRTDDDGQGGLWFEIAKERISIRLTAPYSRNAGRLQVSSLRKTTHFGICTKEAIMKKVVSCAFNIDTTSVEVKCADTCK